MKATINREGCISCGLCVHTCPQIFRLASDGLAEVHQSPVPHGAEATTIYAKDRCPTSVISIIEDGHVDDPLPQTPLCQK